MGRMAKAASRFACELGNSVVSIGVAEPGRYEYRVRSKGGARFALLVIGSVAVWGSILLFSGMWIPDAWPKIRGWWKLRDAPVERIKIVTSADELRQLHEERKYESAAVPVMVEPEGGGVPRAETLFINPADAFSDVPLVASKGKDNIPRYRNRDLSALAGGIIEVKRAPYGLVVDWQWPCGFIVAPTMFCLSLFLFGIAFVGAAVVPGGTQEVKNPTKLRLWVSSFCVAVVLGLPIGAGLGAAIGSYAADTYGPYAELISLLAALVFVPVAAVVISIQLRVAWKAAGSDVSRT